jgi:nanoRNase/pAp phosphatase (c-di-AMP/oligoRNAs hydrolase)
MLDLENQIFRQIEKANSILIIFKMREENDALAAALALFLFLKNNNKEVDIVNIGDKTRNSLSFLPSFEKINSKLENIRRFIVSLNIKNATVNQIKYSLDKENLNFIISPSSGFFSEKDLSSKAGEFRYDLIISLASPDLESFGSAYDNNVEFFYKTTIINIDNDAKNEEFGQINYIDLNTVTLSEIIYYLIKNYHLENIDEEIATCLLAGIIKKTKNFKTGNLSPKTLLTGSELIERGAKRDDIIKNLFYSKSFDSLKAWGEILNKLKSENNNKFLWSRLDNESSDFQLSSLDEMVDELIGSLPETKSFVVIKKSTKNRSSLRLFSLNGVSALELLKNYQTSGNHEVAEIELDQDLNTTANKTIPEIINKLQKLSS